ncbi:hypothetical protein [Micromonospora sp. CPCC 206061]|uniref:hypothetical protein n=1 Tax=Micromonospora sp. CPCC 206061 TaxID=3122410 RepID=UPI002FF23E91
MNDDDAAVVEFGAQEPRSRRAALTDALSKLRRDPRVVPVVAGLAGLAIFASLAGEWQVTTINEPDFFGQGLAPAPVSAGLGELGGWSAAYLVGVFALVGCVALVLFAQPAARDLARVIGLAVAGTLGAVVVAIAFDLNDRSLAISSLGIYNGPDAPQYELTYGRGLTMAFLGVGGLALALYLAGRLTPAQAPVAATATSGAAGPTDAAGQPAAESDWPWRRPAAKETPVEVPQPIDLTVSPAAPFVPLSEQPDRD